MRKVTGYIGALIVVVALMGSVLAGYALNINGQSIVINEYENVTDISGLYSHTDEKTYMDYNPASNYIGYKTKDRYTNTAAANALTVKRMADTDILEISNKNVTYNGVSQGTFITNGTTYYEAFFSQFAFLSTHDSLSYWVLDVGYPYTWASINTNDLTITINGNTVNITGTNTANQPLNYTFTSKYNLCWHSGPDYDYFYNRGYAELSGTLPAYFSDDWPIYSYGGGSQRITSSNDTISGSETGATWTEQLFSSRGVNDSVRYTNNAYYTTNPICYHIFYPKYVYYTTSGGVDYTESNRVNNYIVGYRDIGGSPVTTSSRVDLQDVSTYNYATPNKNWIMATGWTDLDENLNPIWDYQTIAPATYTVYKFTDLLTSISLPANTVSVKVKIPIVDSGNYDSKPFLNVTWGWPDGSDLETGTSMAYNLVMIGNVAGTYNYDVSDDLYYNNHKINNNNLFRTATYDVASGLVNIYDYNGTKILTDSVNNIYIQYLKNPGTSGTTKYINRNTAEQVTKTYRTFYVSDEPGAEYTAPVSVIDVDITTSTSTQEPIYMDITKGIKIDPSNVSDVTWNNEYENGRMQLLFRAEDTYSAYHNEFTVSDNSISIDYTGGHFFISLNGGEAIDVGLWRNIILNLDLLNGDVTANPVRTFNSYTNAAVDRAVIDIGNLVNAAPITSITWEQTSNSLMFSVYSTDVFLNTYGVVMVNPSLTITNYFTDLNNFYRLVLDNFSTFGDSITVNGVTGEVSGNTVTFNDGTVTLKDIDITYADGHAYIEDGYTSIDLGTIVTNNISLSGAWYFETELERGYTALKQTYSWDWQNFILDNTQFCIFYIGLALVGLVVARRFCIITVIDYAVLITSIIIALSTQVIA